MGGFLRKAAFAALTLIPLAAQPTVQEVVSRFDAAQAKVATLQAPFSLTIRRAMLKTPTVTRGTLYLQESDFVHFSFSPPEDLVLHLTPKALISYSPAEGAAEQLKIGIIKNANRKFLGLGQRLSYLSDYFKISVGDGKGVAGSILLTLEPRSYSVKKRMQVLLIWVDKDTYLPRQLNWVERGGDSWLLELGPLTTNQPLPAGVTGFKLPPGIPIKDEFSFFATRRK
ncbi:outer membrane lipoprotein carrier protein LolA [Geothrix sp. 21YS21S-2]|uniref:LolA family protein n=1 Tax=Geothrix sp. 21YS21S-2 TaxID=3068893 RepID=UPI0027BADE5D|nr:outer membrane lipoprotein carrier protein LolA [Geothrix sp. 21YS21S-2]